MDEVIRLRGTIASGEARGASFTEISWVQEGFARLVGFRAYPGTLNLLLPDAAAREAWAHVRRRGGRLLPPEEEDCCEARLFPGRVRALGREGQIGQWRQGAAIVPMVPGYPVENRVEFIAPGNLREALFLCDGDLVEVEFVAEST